jgi:dCTP diphosphatase
LSELEDLRDAMRAFTAQRGWAQLHDPKSLVLALVGEVGELAERFQWLPADDAAELVRVEPLRTQVGDELADVLLYLVRLADVLEIDLADAANTKMAKNRAKHPVGDPEGGVE